MEYVLADCVEVRDIRQLNPLSFILFVYKIMSLNSILYLRGGVLFSYVFLVVVVWVGRGVVLRIILIIHIFYLLILHFSYTLI